MLQSFLEFRLLCMYLSSRLYAIILTIKECAEKTHLTLEIDKIRKKIERFGEKNLNSFQQKKGFLIETHSLVIPFYVPEISYPSLTLDYLFSFLFYLSVFISTSFSLSLRDLVAQLCFQSILLFLRYTRLVQWALCPRKKDQRRDESILSFLFFWFSLICLKSRYFRNFFYHSIIS